MNCLPCPISNAPIVRAVVVIRGLCAFASQVISHSQTTRKALGGGLVEHFKFLLVMGPTELDKEIKARFQAWDTDKGGSLNKEEMLVSNRGIALWSGTGKVGY